MLQFTMAALLLILLWQPAILVAEQLVGSVLAVADTALVLSGGRVVLAGSAAELRGNQALLATYLGTANSN